MKSFWKLLIVGDLIFNAPKISYTLKELHQKRLNKNHSRFFSQLI